MRETFENVSVWVCGEMQLRDMKVSQVSFGMQLSNFAIVVMRNVGQCMCVYLWPRDDFSTRKRQLVKASCRG